MPKHSSAIHLAAVSGAPSPAALQKLVERSQEANVHSFKIIDRIQAERDAEIEPTTWERLFKEWRVQNIELDRRYVTSKKK